MIFFNNKGVLIINTIKMKSVLLLTLIFVSVVMADVPAKKYVIMNTFDGTTYQSSYIDTHSVRVSSSSTLPTGNNYRWVFKAAYNAPGYYFITNVGGNCYLYYDATNSNF